MADIFWTGKLSPLAKFLVNSNHLLAYMKRTKEEDSLMKRRIRLGYNSEFTNHVIDYEEKGLRHYTRAAEMLLLLGNINVKDKTVLDVGCGSGILSFLLLKKNPARVVAGDFSDRMLHLAKDKVIKEGYGDQVRFLYFDAESLPFGNGHFDIAISGLVMGVVPNQAKMISEMARVVKRNGIVAISTHGPKHYYEACEAAFRTAHIPYILGYRVEFWPQKESLVRSLLLRAGLVDIVTKTIIWQETFDSGEEAYDFFTASSSGWWYGKFPPEERLKESAKTRDYFQQKGITKITSEIVFAYGRKP